MTADVEQTPRSALATIAQVHDRMELPACDREAAEAAAGRDAKAENTRRAYGRGWAAFTAWTEAHDYR